MRRTDFTENSPGEIVDVQTPQGLSGIAFVPDFLPIRVDLPPRITTLAEDAGFALGVLNGLGSSLSNPMIFSQPFIRQEAVASTRIEGTRTDLKQLVLFESQQSLSLPENPDDQEALNYVRALELGWQNEEMAVTSRHGLLTLHHELLQSTRGAQRNPGEFRRLPVFIGGVGTNLSTARFVPPPPEFLSDLLDNLLSSAEPSPDLSRLIHLAILHYQFETIHPFEDGNGRTGRLLIPLYLKYWGLLNQPLLSLSLFFERHRREYIDLLYGVSTRGDWDEWISFFLTGIREQSLETSRKAQEILELQSRLRQTYQKDRSPHILPVLERALASVAVTVDDLAMSTEASKSTLYGILRQLESDGVLQRSSLGGNRNAYVLGPLMGILQGTEPHDP